MTRCEAIRIKPVRALLHPLWLSACALLIVNDHVFKGAGIVHDVATGKLSDFAGMIVAPSLLAALAGVKRRRGLVVSHVAVGALFSLIQLAAGARLVEGVMAPLAWRIWPDATDLVALPLLLVSFRVLGSAMERPLPVGSALRDNAQIAAVVIGLLACLGTSSVPPETPAVGEGTRVAHDSRMAGDTRATSGLDLAALTGRWQSEGDGVRVRYRFDGDRYVATGYPAFEESGRVVVVHTSGRVMAVRLVDRLHNGQHDAALEIAIEVSKDGNLITVDGARYRRIEQQMAAAAEADMADEMVGP